MSRTSIALFVITILGGIGSLVLMSGVIKARRGRLEAVESRFEKLDGLGDAIVEDDRVSEGVATRLLTLQKEWGRVWPNVGPVSVDDNTQAIVSFQVGEARGIGQGVRNGAGLPNLHIFGVQAGETTYIGEFQATAVEPNQTVAKLERLPFEGEVDTWNYDGYRVREAIPPSYNALLANLVTVRNVATQDLLEENQRIARGQNQLAASQEILEMRLDELNGNPLADAASDEIRSKGLVKMLVEREATRDELSASVDRLRRVYSQKSDELQQRIQRVRQLAGELPGGSNVSTPDLGAGLEAAGITR